MLHAVLVSADSVPGGLLPISRSDLIALMLNLYQSAISATNRVISLYLKGMSCT